MFELYDYIVGLGLFATFILCGIYIFISICCSIYRYALGDDFPEVERIAILFTSGRLLNPFYFKHPADIALGASLIGISILTLAMVWPFIIPIGIVWYGVINTRAKNLHKKKMWETLKE